MRRHIERHDDPRTRANRGAAPSGCDFDYAHLEQRSFAHDLLIALTCREAAAILVTANADDFELIRNVTGVRFGGGPAGGWLRCAAPPHGCPHALPAQAW